jgi:lysophospholipase L1-like esterase
MTSRPSIALALTLPILAGCGLLVGYKAYPLRHPANTHAVRDRAIASQAAQLGHVDTLLVGDSIVELSYIPELCGTVLNAGVGGSGIAELEAELPVLQRELKPKLIVIATGVNEGARAKKVDVADFRGRYVGLIRLAKASGARVAVANVPPVSDVGPLGVKNFDPAVLRALSSAVDSSAAQENVKLLDVRAALEGPDGALRPDDTEDGVHLRPSGYGRWRPVIMTACK